jgi:hypothetical protein
MVKDCGGNVRSWYFLILIRHIVRFVCGLQANPKVAHELQQKRMAEEGGGAGHVQPAKGSVQYVALSDVLSGKAALPT